MAQTQFSLCWAGHKRNVCTGLSSLQQNGEFVDLTLAADGHHVKVHQIVVALASPYIKELIESAQCQHPVIVLNKISYNALAAILEYIYTGEVLVSVENLSELLEAGKTLHIKGLEDMKVDPSHTPQQHAAESYTKSETEREETEDVEEYCYFEITNSKDDEKYETIYEPVTDSTHVESMDDATRIQFAEDMQTQECDNTTELTQDETTNEPDADIYTTKLPDTVKAECVKKPSSASMMQFTVSNQGSLQMILNRFVYYLKHTNRDGTRQWRCVDYLVSHRCPAFVITKGDVVTQRVSAHTHSFHDKKIMKKVQAGTIFTAFHDALKEGDIKKNKDKHVEYLDSYSQDLLESKVSKLADSS
ncbi:modifier of mdg4-like [Pectinophora gossypiella]|uniref:BTB domain-containing protein n=1 Tax=Pectinophora gossypiella TaxID=13191 RepID=A0A1E1WN00_PECGO|nr:modifier of mdg4-like [Pectinophora gossypiella]